MIRNRRTGVVKNMRIKAIALPALAAIVVAALALAFAPTRGGSSASRSTVSASGKTVRVTIHDYAYYPQNLTVRAGTTIVVTNTDQTQHTLTANSGAFDTGTLNSGQTGRFTVNKPGTYPYHCQFHAFMVGTIRVVG